MKTYIANFYCKRNKPFMRCKDKCTVSFKIEAPGKGHARHLAWLELAKTDYRRFGPVDFKLKVFEEE